MGLKSAHATSFLVIVSDLVLRFRLFQSDHYSRMHSLEEEGVCIDLSLPNALVLALLILDSILTELLELSLEVSPLKLPFPVGVTIVVRVLVTTFPPGSVLVCVATEVTGSAVVD